VQERREGDPEATVLENARRKARAGLELALAGGADDPLLVVACDTEVVIDGEVLGKAAGLGEARARLERLSGRTHDVLGGLVLLDAGGDRAQARERSGVAHSAVTFRDLDPATVDLYLRSGEWRDRAGAYAIQGLGSILVARVEGDVANVIGLPVTLLTELAPELLAPSPADAENRA
jgi:septum formation protein